ncbi:unnamed protein product [Rotaria sordida]|uniref:Nuclear receptor domain-containing protein n=1 Tax=Rotaria sordida TaxID=392033 RepID=A0A814UU25_9BILA|nr:unnamed protein product [Rotaria sordida]
MKNLSSKNSTNKKRQSTIETSGCKVCGAPAQYSYYGTLACHACKAFFKRNAKHGQEVLKCDWDDNCEVNVNNRHVCSYCRLMKCFACGMQINMFRSFHQKKKETSQKRKAMDDHLETPSTTLLQLTQPEQVILFDYHT